MPIPAAFDLSGRVAVVTGAGSPDGIAAAVIADLTDAGAAAGLVTATLQQWGRLDIVVNNAGMVSVASPVFEAGTADSMDLATWQASLARNLTTAFLVTRAALPAMIERGWGRIIMVSSVTGPVMAIRADVGYASAKAGMVGLTRATAVDAAGHGVTVNAVAPGWIASGSLTPEERAQGQATPAGRSGSPGEVAAAITWLASPGASYITGQYLVVDGGNSIAEQRAAPA
jgi:3-oxoacyl-[acyl-carrier protein] reductase